MSVTVVALPSPSRMREPIEPEQVELPEIPRGEDTFYLASNDCWVTVHPDHPVLYLGAAAVAVRVWRPDHSEQQELDEMRSEARRAAR
jgi:hypothetical protein